MSASNHTAPTVDLVNPQDPATWLKPGEKLIGADGRDWAWTYVVYAEAPDFPAYCAGTNGTVWTRWKRIGTTADGRRGSSFVMDDTWKRLKPIRQNNDYMTVCLSNGEQGSKRLVRTVHSLVLGAHVGPRPPRMDCRHLDGVRSHNRIRNLVWGTKVENQADRIRHGTDSRGEQVGTSKLTEADVIEIRRMVASGTKKAALARKYGVTFTAIWSICERRSWAHV
jgi:hypothetical protein